VAIGSGVYTLVGVVVGTAATGGFQWWLAARKDGRDARAARRLVNAELTQIAFAVKAVGEHPEWGASEEMQRRMAAHASWDRYAEVLARDLGKDEWSTLPIAYETAEAFADLAAVASKDKAAQLQNKPVLELAQRHLLNALEATKDKETQLPAVEMGLTVGGVGVSVGRSTQSSDDPSE
jgi:hypothetical protein